MKKVKKIKKGGKCERREPRSEWNSCLICGRTEKEIPDEECLWQQPVFIFGNQVCYECGNLLILNIMHKAMNWAKPIYERKKISKG